MSLKTAIVSGVNAAFNALSSLSLDVSVRHFIGPDMRNPVDGTYSRPYVDYAAKGILTGLKGYEDRADLLASDKGMVVRQSEVPNVTTGDEVTFGSVKHKVIGVERDPSISTYQLILRETT